MFDVVAVLQWVACQVRSWRRKAAGPAPAAWLGPDAAAGSSSSVPAAAAAASSSVPAAAASSSVPAASGEEMSAEEMLQQLDPVVCLAFIRR